MSLTRRDLLKSSALAAATLAASPLLSFAQQNADPAAKPKRLLFFTKIQDHPHAVVARKPNPDGTPSNELALAEKLLKQWAEAAGYNITITKDGSLFTKDYLNQFDAFLFYTLGDLTQPPAVPAADHTPPMTQEGKSALLDAIAAGKGFVGIHSATDTFRDITRKDDPVTLWKPGIKLDPFIAMLGGEFTNHAKQQKATFRVASRDLPSTGPETHIKDTELLEEWYAFTNLQPDLHVILTTDTTTMAIDPKTKQRDKQYQGPPYPNTWARMHNKGRVFYTALGHREETWNADFFKELLMAAIAWTTRTTNADLHPNLNQTCPDLHTPA